MDAKPKTYVAYYRVSTQRQGTSGLGLEAQQAAARDYTSRGAVVLAEFVEVESGKKDNRPQLMAAIAAAQAAGATLLIAKLDRLSRNASFIFALRDAGVDFVCADMPDANTMTIGIFAVLAQHERELISRRTRDALTAKKARGEQLGTPGNLTLEARERGLLTRQENARQHRSNVQAARLSALLQSQGLSLRQIANELNATGYQTRRGKHFHPQGVQRLLIRASCLPVPKSAD